MKGLRLGAIALMLLAAGCGPAVVPGGTTAEDRVSARTRPAPGKAAPSAGAPTEAVAPDQTPAPASPAANRRAVATPSPPPVGFTVATLAGTGNPGTADGPAADASFLLLNGIAAGPRGDLFVVDAGDHRVRRIGLDAPVHPVTAVAGAGEPGYADGVGTAAKFDKPARLAFGPDGNLYVADVATNSIRRIGLGPDGTGTVTTFVGGQGQGYVDGPTGVARLAEPCGLAFGPGGDLFFTERINHRIRRAAPDGTVSTVAGSGALGATDGPALEAQFARPLDLAVARDGTVYLADTYNNRIVRVAAGQATTIAGNSTLGFRDGTGDVARFDLPGGIVLDERETPPVLYVTELEGNMVRRLTLAGPAAADVRVDTIAGAWQPGDTDGPGWIARFDRPVAITLGAPGILYVADQNGRRVRQLTRAAAP